VLFNCVVECVCLVRQRCGVWFVAFEAWSATPVHLFNGVSPRASQDWMSWLTHSGLIWLESVTTRWKKRPAWLLANKCFHFGSIKQVLWGCLRKSRVVNIFKFSKLFLPYDYLTNQSVRLLLMPIAEWLSKYCKNQVAKVGLSNVHSVFHWGASYDLVANRKPGVFLSVQFQIACAWGRCESLVVLPEPTVTKPEKGLLRGLVLVLWKPSLLPWHRTRHSHASVHALITDHCWR